MIIIKDNNKRKIVNVIKKNENFYFLKSNREKEK